jgi:hypothetical protein
MKPWPILLIALPAACAAPQPAAAPAPRQQAGELAGRTAGAPQDCIPIYRTEALRVADGDTHLLLYGRGSTIWASSLGPGCGFSHSDVLITESHDGRYCRGDLVRSTDGMSRVPGPTCVLGEFVPYKR